jgi:hypothetical protein
MIKTQCRQYKYEQEGNAALKRANTSRVTHNANEAIDRLATISNRDHCQISRIPSTAALQKEEYTR